MLTNPFKNKTKMDRPITGNADGKYNMNFVDWTNEWERIVEDDELDYYMEIDR